MPSLNELPLPRPLYLEAQLATAKHRWEFRSPSSGRMIHVISDRPITEAVCDMMHAAMAGCKPVPTVMS